MEQAIYDIIVRNGEGKITDTVEGEKRTVATEFLRSLLRGMDYDEVTVQIQKRIPV